MLVTNNTILHLVYGKSNTGKTHTICEIIHHLFNNKAKSIFFVLSTKDIHCILEHTNNNGKKLVYAIMSAGDDDCVRLPMERFRSRL